MYCEKLKSILEENQDAETKFLIQKLDGFIRNQTTTLERKRINPLKFSIERTIEAEVAYRLFQKLTIKGLFRALAFYRCKCGDQIYIDKTLKDEYECECEDRVIIPYFEKKRIYIYFELLEKVENCSQESAFGESDQDQNDTDIPQELFDCFEVYNSGKPEASLAKIEEITGNQSYYEDTIMSQRAKDRRNSIRILRNESS